MKLFWSGSGRPMDPKAFGNMAHPKKPYVVVVIFM